MLINFKFITFAGFFLNCFSSSIFAASVNFFIDFEEMEFPVGCELKADFNPITTSSSIAKVASVDLINDFGSVWYVDHSPVCAYSETNAVESSIPKVLATS